MSTEMYPNYTRSERWSLSRGLNKSRCWLSAKSSHHREVAIVESWLAVSIGSTMSFIIIHFPHSIDFNFQIFVLGQLLCEFCWGVTFRWSCYVNEHAPSFFPKSLKMPWGLHRGGEFIICTSPIIHLVCPRKFCIGIVFYFFQHHCNTQEKLKTKITQRFGQFWNWLVHRRGFTVLKLLVCSWHHDSHNDKKELNHFHPLGHCKFCDKNCLVLSTNMHGSMWVEIIYQERSS